MGSVDEDVEVASDVFAITANFFGASGSEEYFLFIFYVDRKSVV